MRRHAFVVPMALLMAATGAIGALAPSDQEGAMQGANHYIVALVALPVGVAAGDTFHGARVLQVMEGVEFLLVEVGDYDGFHASALKDDNVRYVEWDDPAYAVIDFVPNDSRYNDAGHWGSKKIGAETAWDRTRGTTAVKVGMLDTGIYRTHEDVTGSRLLQGYDFYNNDNDPNDTSGCSWHGSHTSGTAGATINNARGIAGLSQHTILPVKAFAAGGFGCSGSTSALVNGLRYIGDQGGHLSSNSWGSSANTQSINDAIVYAHGKGTIHVAAAGNSGPCTNCISYPWKVNDARTIIATATDSNDNLASFSSQGPQSDVAAPGVSILSLKGGATNAYQTLSGTSMACPHVTGTAALIKALHSTWTFSQVESQLKSTALDRGPAGEDDQYGAGRIRANLAVV